MKHIVLPRRIAVLTIIAASLAVAGPLKVASYPVRHPVKTVKGLGKAVKAIVW